MEYIIIFLHVSFDTFIILHHLILLPLLHLCCLRWSLFNLLVTCWVLSDKSWCQNNVAALSKSVSANICSLCDYASFLDISIVIQQPLLHHCASFVPGPPSPRWPAQVLWLDAGSPAASGETSPRRSPWTLNNRHNRCYQCDPTLHYSLFGYPISYTHVSLSCWRAFNVKNLRRKCLVSSSMSWQSGTIEKVELFPDTNSLAVKKIQWWVQHDSVGVLTILVPRKCLLFCIY